MTDRYVAIHKNPQGLGDARPTAAQIVKDEELEGKLSGQVILITGTSSGTGAESAKALYPTGATLFVTARDLPKARAALGDILDSDRVHLLELELESLESVRQCAAAFLAQSDKLNILIENAGVMMPPEGRTKDGFETQFGVNHLAHFLLFELLRPALLAGASSSGKPSRVVILSSMAHRWGEVQFDNINFEGKYDAQATYGQSKTANVYVATEIERRYGAQGIHAWAVHPGMVMTDLARHMPDGALEKYLEDPYLASTAKTAEQGASTSLWAATAAALEGKGGKYLEDCQISVPWDPSSNNPMAPGSAPWAYDEDKAKKLWEKSVEWVSL